MRKQFVSTVEELITLDEKTVLLLGDIGVFGFRNSLISHPKRVYNIGILEQSTIGLAAGLSMTGMIPFVHTIAPFLVERCYEQLKDDFCYQELGGNFISVGASYDYSALGSTHHCPGDVGILKLLPGMEIILPGTAKEFDALLKECYNNNKPTYYRLSEFENTEDNEVSFGKANVIQTGSKATVIAIGPTLSEVKKAVAGLDVSLLYYTTVAPFDMQTLREHSQHGKIFVCEPNYGGSIYYDIIQALKPNSVQIDGVSVPHLFLNNYGSKLDHDKALGFTEPEIKSRVINFINETEY